MLKSVRTDLKRPTQSDAKTKLEVRKLRWEVRKLGYEAVNIRSPWWRYKEVFAIAATVVTLLGLAANLFFTWRNAHENTQRKQATQLLSIMSSPERTQRVSAGLMLSQLDPRYNFEELYNAYERSVAAGPVEKRRGEGSTPFLRVGIIEALSNDAAGWPDTENRRFGIFVRALKDPSPLVRAAAADAIQRTTSDRSGDVSIAYRREKETLASLVQTARVAGGEMIRIPAGTAVLGSEVDLSESPMRDVWHESFWIDRAPVTNAQWQSVMADRPTQLEIAEVAGESAAAMWRAWRASHPALPVVGVTFSDAAEYCRRTGARVLPTEWEWEVAARGRSGWTFPWGMDSAAGKSLVQLEADAKAKNLDQGTFVSSVSTRHKDDVSTFGLEGAVTSIRQWTRSEWEERPSVQSSTPAHPNTNCERQCVLRGSAVLDPTGLSEQRFRVARRNRKPPSQFDDNIGFRCAAASLPQSTSQSQLP